MLSEDFIAGTFAAAPSPQGEVVVLSPADQADTVTRFVWSPGQVDQAVSSACEAFTTWGRRPQMERAALLRAYQEALKRHAEELARQISREIGKPLWESKTEVQSMIGKVDLTLGEASRFTADHRLEDLPGEIRHRPHGVVAVVGPFNFPGHLPNGQLVPALLLGNTVVFKPSEKGPGVATLMARCFLEAGFPPGVVNVVHGPAPVAEALVSHSGIDAILFTGSLPVGQRIVALNAHRPGVLVALELGGKNASLVLDDADLERTVRELFFSGFATAGQRCTATSRVIITEKLAEPLLTRLAQAARAAVVGAPFDEGVFMGPVINEATMKRTLEAQRLARASGYEALVEGGPAEVKGKRGWYLRPAVHVSRRPRAVKGYSDTELFSPDLCVQVVGSVDEAVTVANEGDFGLSAAVFTQSRELFERCAAELRVGVLHWNRSSAGASGRLPFGGIRASGNHRPAGILMGTSCVYPQAVLLAPASAGALPSWPGASFD